MRGSLRRLKACYFESEFVQRSSSLLALLGFFEGCVAEKSPGDCQSFAVNKVGGRGANIRLQSRSDGQKGARKSPKPFRRFILCQSDEGFLQTTMKSFDQSVRGRVVGGREVRFNAPCFHELSPNR